MNIENQLVFFFSIIGSFNGLLLSFYFAFKTRENKRSNYFLSLLILMLSIRTMKSVFFHFNPQLSGIFIQIGLSALTLIGPLLYLYLKAHFRKGKINWFIHIFPILIGITLLAVYFPYVEHSDLWSSHIVGWINNFWFVYIVISFRLILPSVKKIFRKQKLLNIDIWLISLYTGILIVWSGYTFGTYASYIAGALSFSIVLYLIILLLIFKISEKASFFEKKEKYKNKVISQHAIEVLEKKIPTIKEKEMFLTPNLTLVDIAKEFNVSKHEFSQYLNEKLGKSFSTFINEYRIEKAKALLASGKNLSIDGIGYESGFKSKSTFYSSFKKITGMTPAEYRKTTVF